jgi:hypothetical protein
MFVNLLRCYPYLLRQNKLGASRRDKKSGGSAPFWPGLSLAAFICLEA